MSTQLYSLCEVYLNGSKLAEEASVKLTRDSKAQQVDTVARGFAGLSPGAKMMSITVDNAVPAAAFEVDPSRYIGTLEVVELTLYAAGKTLTTKGFIISDNFSHAVNSASSLSFDFIGDFANWE